MARSIPEGALLPRRPLALWPVDVHREVGARDCALPRRLRSLPAQARSAEHFISEGRAAVMVKEHPINASLPAVVTLKYRLSCGHWKYEYLAPGDYMELDTSDLSCSACSRRADQAAGLSDNSGSTT
jgi:hypothetical protein